MDYAQIQYEMHEAAQEALRQGNGELYQRIFQRRIELEMGRQIKARG